MTEKSGVGLNVCPREYRLRVYIDGKQSSDAWMPKRSWEAILEDVRAFYRLRDEQKYLKPECTAQIETRAHGPAPWKQPRENAILQHFGHPSWSNANCRDERSGQALDRSSRRVGAKADQLTPRGPSGDSQ